MNSIFAFLLVSFVAVSQSAGQTAKSEELAKKLVMVAPDYTNIYGVAKTMIKGKIKFKKLQVTPAQTETIEKAVIASVYTSLVQMYQNSFSAAELGELVKFYESPTGKKWRNFATAESGSPKTIYMSLGPAIDKELAKIK